MGCVVDILNSHRWWSLSPVLCTWWFTTLWGLVVIRWSRKSSSPDWWLNPVFAVLMKVDPLLKICYFNILSNGYCFLSLSDIWAGFRFTVFKFMLVSEREWVSISILYPWKDKPVVSIFVVRFNSWSANTLGLCSINICCIVSILLVNFALPLFHVIIFIIWFPLRLCVCLLFDFWLFLFNFWVDFLGFYICCWCLFNVLLCFFWYFFYGFVFFYVVFWFVLLVFVCVFFFFLFWIYVFFSVAELVSAWVPSVSDWLSSIVSSDSVFVCCLLVVSVVCLFLVMVCWCLCPNVYLCLFLWVNPSVVWGSGLVSLCFFFLNKFPGCGVPPPFVYIW